MYRNFQSCSAQLAEVKPVDYFLAKKLMETIDITNVDVAHSNTLFHCLMALSHALNEGHTCLSLHHLAGVKLWGGESSSLLDLGTHEGFRFPDFKTLESIFELLTIADDDEQPLVYQLQRVYLRRYWKFETEVADNIRAMLDEIITIDKVAAKNIISTLFNAPAFEAIDKQKLAVANALNKKLIVIAGGPGTGKTTTVAKLLIALQQLHNNSLTIAMAGPTGKSAQRLNESLEDSKKKIASQCQLDVTTLDSIPTNASTVHRLLGVIKQSHNFKHDQYKLLDIDVLLIDEISMIDLPMMARVLRALPIHARLILLGDADQLASVEVGSILADIAPRGVSGYSQGNCDYLAELTDETLDVNPAGLDHLSLLTFSHRFKDDGGIGKLASAVISGDQNASWNLLDVGDSEIERVANQPFAHWLNELFVKYYLPIFNASSIDDAFNALDNFRILSALRKGEYGVETINNSIEKILKTRGVIKGNSNLYAGRPIMVCANDYGLSLYNGDIGLLWPNADGKLQAVFPIGEDEFGQRTYRWITPARLPVVETVFSMTIHKTQGSEFNSVAIVLPEKETPLLSRELLYTGITRAKKHIQFYGNEKVFKRSVVKKVLRHSALKERLNFI
jgi:exodeoxyribonuclease V alpha subunit